MADTLHGRDLPLNADTMTLKNYVVANKSRPECTRHQCVLIGLVDRNNESDMHNQVLLPWGKKLYLREICTCRPRPFLFIRRRRRKRLLEGQHSDFVVVHHGRRVGAFAQTYDYVLPQQG